MRGLCSAEYRFVAAYCDKANSLQRKEQLRRESRQDDPLVSHVALQYTKLMILNLTNRVNRFK